MPETEELSAKKIESDKAKNLAEAASPDSVVGSPGSVGNSVELNQSLSGHPSQQNVLQLQRSLGNSYVMRKVIQRDPANPSNASPSPDANAASGVWQVPVVFGGTIVNNAADASAQLIDIKRKLDPLKDQFDGIPIVVSAIDKFLPETYGNASSDPLKPDMASKLTTLGLLALGAYNAALNQMKTRLRDNLGKIKVDKADEMLEDGADILHATAFGKGDDNEALEHAKEGFEKLHIFVEWAHYTNEWVVKALNIAQSADKFEKIAEALEKAGEFGEKASIAIAALNSAIAFYSAIKVSKDPGKSGTQKAVAQTKAGLSLVPVATAGAATVASLTVTATGIGLMWTTLVPQIEQGMHMVEQLDERVAAYYKTSIAEDWWEEAKKAGGRSAPQIRADQISHFPGGQETLNFMWAVFQGSPPEKAPAVVEKFFYDTREKMNVGHDEKGDNDEMDTEWHLFKANEVKNLIPWVQSHKEEVWGMLYGSLSHP